MKSQRHQLLQWASCVLLLLLAGCAQVSEPTRQVTVLADGEALRKDATEYAKDQNISVDEAVWRMELQDEIGRLDVELSESASDVFGGLWIEHSPDFRIVISLTADPSVVQPYIDRSGLSDLVVYKRVSRTLQALEEAQIAAGKLAEGIVGNKFQSGLDVKNNTAELYVLDASVFKPSVQARALGTNLDAVEVIEVQSFGVEDANLMAGDTITSCTTGYTVVDGNGLVGTTTSGHCGPGANGSGDQYFGSVLLRFIYEWYGGPRDVQWHTSTGVTFKPWARDDQPNSGGTPYYRQIYALANRPDVPLGFFVCKYGKVTKHKCGYIEDKNFNPGGVLNSPTYVRASRNGELLRARGDSGGPVYDGHKALGLHRGGFDLNSGEFSGDMYYMAINYLTDVRIQLLFAPQ